MLRLRRITDGHRFVRQCVVNSNRGRGKNTQPTILGRAGPPKGHRTDAVSEPGGPTWRQRLWPTRTICTVCSRDPCGADHSQSNMADGNDSKDPSTWWTLTFLDNHTRQNTDGKVVESSCRVASYLKGPTASAAAAPAPRLHPRRGQSQRRWRTPRAMAPRQAASGAGAPCAAAAREEPYYGNATGHITIIKTGEADAMQCLTDAGASARSIMVFL